MVWCGVVYCVVCGVVYGVACDVMWCGVVFGAVWRECFGGLYLVIMRRFGETCGELRMLSLLEEYYTLHVESARRMTMILSPAPPPGEA